MVPRVGDLQPVPSAGKCATCAERAKTFDRRQARENGQVVPYMDERDADAEPGKTCNTFRARENVQVVSSVGKQESGNKRA